MGAIVGQPSSLHSQGYHILEESQFSTWCVWYCGLQQKSSAHKYLVWNTESTPPTPTVCGHKLWGGASGSTMGMGVIAEEGCPGTLSPGLHRCGVWALWREAEQCEPLEDGLFRNLLSGKRSYCVPKGWGWVAQRTKITVL